MGILKETILCVESKIYNPQREILESYGTLQQTISRTLFNHLVANPKLEFKEQQREYSAKYKIHVRLFKSIWKDIKGKIKSIESNNKNHKTNLKTKIEDTKDKIKYYEKQNKHVHWLKNKLNKLKQRLEEFDEKEIHSMWGSKAFYKKQWNYANGHESWLKEWNKKRNHMIYLIGSHDESFGNSLCQLQNLDKLVLTLPHCFKDKQLELKVNFNHKKKIYQYLKQAINNGQALTYRIFERENGNWYVQISFRYINECELQDKNLGIDINYNLFTSCIVKEDGNPSIFKDFKFDIEKKSSNQIKEELIRIGHQIVNHAKTNKTNIIVEDIDLEKQKQKDKGKKVNRKINMIAYRKFLQYLRSYAVKQGVLVIEVHPAYTSVSAKIKYALPLGRSVHQCSALTIGRRGFNYVERVPFQIACLLRSGEKKKHSWGQWACLVKRLQKVLEINTLAYFFTELKARGGNARSALHTVTVNPDAIRVH